MELISVILTTFNGATRGYLEDAIKSVLNQTYLDYELIIIDDGSSDDTNKICAKYTNDKNVKYLYQKNKGLPGARNYGIANSIGEYICFLDDDDIWIVDKLEKEIKFMSTCTDKDLGMVYTSLELINEKNEIIGYQSSTASGDIYEKLFYENLVNAPSSVMIKRKVFNNVGTFKEYMYSDEDNEMWIRIAKEYNIYSINEPLVKYRIHNNKMSTNFAKMEFYQIYTFYQALSNAPDYIKKDEWKVYNNLYRRFANKHFSLNNYNEFKKYYFMCRAYGSVGIKLKLKFILARFPYIAINLRKLKIMFSK